MAEAKVLFDYQASQDDELTIIVGDIIKNVVMSDGGWWEGEKNGQKGLFPDNFVEIISTGKNDNSNRFQIRKGHITEMANKIKDGIQIGAMMSSKKISVGSKKKKLAKVQFEYIPEAEDELELHIGDVLEVYREVEEGWWEGQLNGKVGMFPSNFVEIRENPDEEEREKSVKTDEPEKKDSSIDPETKGKKVKGVGFGNIFGSGPIKLRPSSGVWKGETEESKVEKVSGSASTTVKKSKQLEMAIARFSYHAENEDELTLKEGDTITILKKDLEDVGWWKGELNGRIGVFPDNFVEIIPTQEEAPKIKKTYSTSSQDSSVLSSQNNKSTRSNNESNKVDNKHNNNKDSLLGTNVQSSFKRIRDNDSVDKSSLPALPTKKPFLPPPVGKKPAPLKTELSKQPTIDNKDLSKSKVSANVSENKNKDTHKEKDSRDKGFSDFDNFEVPAAEKLVHLTANRVKQPKKRPPSLVFLHSEEEKTEIKETKEKEPLQGEKKQPAVPTAATSIKATIRTENKEVSKFDSVPSHVVAESHTKAKSPSGTTSFEVLAQNEIGSNFTSDEVKELILEIKELKKEMVSKSCYDELKADNEQLHQEIEALKSSFQRRFRNIVNELDEEKKVRLNMQVEIDRMKMLISESTI
ncbi:SH3 domain-containing kinase-binding protein 1 isoform X1 [Octopus sinensis]|uniref:SH3 domain-containing kinase-binding protein 1 isoform X1 n=2 Tax=Octopus sinensis TaxID=2607531 RepID=A0A6P7TEL2_9MOLL|nr:SH3 domain-containing kinase-binding protein 1 isoform X1 [Octopus sinensis]